MIAHPAFVVEPWQIRETQLDLDVLAQTESVFALANGHVGWRGNLDEGEPHGLPGTYLGGVYESWPLPYSEVGYGYPESGQTVVNVTNGKLIRLLVDDEPFDVRYGKLLAHERVLDFQGGVLSRTAEWRSPAGRTVRIRSRRLVSLSQRAIAAVCYEVEPLDGPTTVVLQSELVANEQLPPASGDPRAAAVLEAPLLAEEHTVTGTTVTLVHHTGRSRLRMAAAMDHVIDSPADVHTRMESSPDLGRVTVVANLVPGQRLRLTKFVAYGWSAERSLPAVRDQVSAALEAARSVGWDGLVREQREFLDGFWKRADVQVDGDPRIQQAVRFALFHMLQASARAEGQPIPAKGLTGPGYDGHCFWDTEIFVLPVLTHAIPEAAADALRWRQATLPMARLRAEQLGLRGGAFPWRTISGSECSGYWPAGTAAFHINADIAYAATQYVRVTGDMGFERDTALELLAATARLWQSLGHHDGAGRFRIDGVTGPDEYSAIADNNVYTNLMARHNLRAAAETARRHPDRAHELGADHEEIAAWCAIAEAMCVPYDHALEVHPQAEGFSKHKVWDFAGTAPHSYPLMLHFPYFDLYRKQVVKQADLVLAMQLCGDAFTAEEKLRDFDYYEPLTVRDSSLSAASQAVLAAEVGHMRLARDYLTETALVDLDDSAHNTSNGLHIAALAGTWTALVAGLAGLRQYGDVLRFAPRLTADFSRLAFTVGFHGKRVHVEVRAEAATYSMVEGDAVDLTHHGLQVRVIAGSPLTCAIAPGPDRIAPRQPSGREPLNR